MSFDTFYFYNGNMEFKEIILDDLNHEELKELIGANNTNLDFIKSLFNFEIIFRGNILKVACDNESYKLFCDYIDALVNNIKNNIVIDENLLKQMYYDLKEKRDLSWQNKTIIVTNNGKQVRCKTYNQYLFVNSVINNDLIFSIGPAGTGKTYLAVALACKAYKNDEIKKIILTRPAVEAGESLGFLPGDLKEKIDPYLMPLYDSLYDILGEDQVNKMIEKKVIEIIPLAYMRGRTLNDAFIILDEGQNTTAGQMLMFLTRLGHNSKMIVNGDITQIDLKINKNSSGLVCALKSLKNIKKIAFVEFVKSDVVRNPLVEKIIERFVI